MFEEERVFLLLEITRKRLFMSNEIRDKVEYIVVMIAEFAKAKHLTESQAFRYLRRFKGIALLDSYYAVIHTLRMEDVLEDVAAYCRRHGGAIA